jgi:hypothetical protein
MRSVAKLTCIIYSGPNEKSTEILGSNEKSF